MTRYATLKQSITLLQQKLGLSDEEIRYTRDSLGTSSELAINYHKRLVEIDSIQKYFIKENEMRNQAINHIEQFIYQNQGSRVKMIKLMLVLRQSTVNIFKLLYKLRRTLGYPANFDLSVGLKDSPVQSLLSESWLNLELLSKIVFTINYFENTPLQIVYNKLLKRQPLTQLPNLLFSNEDEDPFPYSIFTYMYVQYNAKTGEAYQMEEYSLRQFEDLRNSESVDVEVYNKNSGYAADRKYQLVYVPTKFTIGKYEQFPLSKYQRGDYKMAMSQSQLKYQLTQTKMEEFRRKQIEEIDYADYIINMQHQLQMSSREIRYSYKLTTTNSNAEYQYFARLDRVVELVDRINRTLLKNAQLRGKLTSEQPTHALFASYLQNVISLFNDYALFQTLIRIKLDQNFECRAVYAGVVQDSDYVLACTARYLLNMQFGNYLASLLAGSPANQTRFLLNEQVQTNDDLALRQQAQFWQAFLQRQSVSYQSAGLSKFQIIEAVDDEAENLEKTARFLQQCHENGVEVCKVPVLSGEDVEVYDANTSDSVVLGKGAGLGYATAAARAPDGGGLQATAQAAQLTLSDFSASGGQRQRPAKTANPQPPGRDPAAYTQVANSQPGRRIADLLNDAQSSESDNFDINDLVK